MVDTIDVWRAAKLVVDEHGAGAWLHAAMWIDELDKGGDSAGAAVWRRIAEAIAKWDDMDSSAEVH
jgi:hypothetical protein